MKAINLIQRLLPLLFLISIQCTRVNSESGTTSKSNKNGVDNITSKNFREALADHSSGYLIAFTAPWCGHCVRLSPVYESVAATLKGTSDIGVGKVDATKEHQLTSMFDVEAYPSIYFIKGWEIREYKGSRSHNALVEFCKSGYKDEPVIPFFFSPFGPLGLFRQGVMSVGNAAISFHEYFVTLSFMGKFIVGGAVFMGLTFGVIFLIALVVLAEERHTKDD